MGEGVDEKGDKKWYGGGGVIKKMMSLTQIFLVFISPAIQFFFLSLYVMGFWWYHSEK